MDEWGSLPGSSFQNESKKQNLLEKWIWGRFQLLLEIFHELGLKQSSSYKVCFLLFIFTCGVGKLERVSTLHMAYNVTWARLLSSGSTIPSLCLQGSLCVYKAAIPSYTDILQLSIIRCHHHSTYSESAQSVPTSWMSKEGVRRGNCLKRI